VLLSLSPVRLPLYFFIFLFHNPPPHDRHFLTDFARISMIFNTKKSTVSSSTRKRACILHASRDVLEKHEHVTYERRNSRSKAKRGVTKRETEEKRERERERERGGGDETRNGCAEEKREKWEKERMKEKEKEHRDEERHRAMCIRQWSAATSFDVSVCVALEAGRGR